MKNKKTYLYFLIGLLLLCLVGLGYWYIFRNNRSSETKTEFPLQTNLAVLYFVEPNIQDKSILLGIDFLKESKNEYKIIKLSENQLESNSLIKIAQSELPKYISIKVTSDDKYIFSFINEQEVNNSIMDSFANEIHKYLYASGTTYSLRAYQRLWLASEGYTKFPNENIRRELSEFPKQYESMNDISTTIMTNDFSKDENTFVTNYSRNYPYSCLVSQSLANSGITNTNYNAELCNLPAIPIIDTTKFGIKNIETIWSQNETKLKEDENINSTTMLIDYWAKGDKDLDNAYIFSLSEAYKLGMTEADVCYWMLVNDLTSYKNNLYYYVIHDENLFNSLNSMYCPSLHVPTHFKYVVAPTNLDINYFVYDL